MPAPDPFPPTIPRLPPAVRVPLSLAILPPPEGTRFTLRNRSSITAWLRARRISLLDPNNQPLPETAKTLAQATQILLADPNQSGLLSLCPPGTQVLEIAPEGWATSHTRAACAALDLDWHLLLATPPSYPVSRALSLGTASPLGYEIPISALNQALAAI